MPVIIIGIISGFLSYLLSFSATTEILRYRYYVAIDNNINLPRYNQTYVNKRKNKFKVKFKDKIKVLSIDSYRNLSEDNLRELWYDKKDYDYFKKEFIKDIKNNTI